MVACSLIAAYEICLGSSLGHIWAWQYTGYVTEENRFLSQNDTYRSIVDFPFRETIALQTYRLLNHGYFNLTASGRRVRESQRLRGPITASASGWSATFKRPPTFAETGLRALACFSFPHYLAIYIPVSRCFSQLFSQPHSHMILGGQWEQMNTQP